MDPEAPSTLWEGVRPQSGWEGTGVCKCRPVLVLFLEARCVSWGRVYRPRMPVHVGLSFRAGEATGDSGGHGRDPGEWNARRVMTAATSQMLHLGERAEGVIVVL